MEPRIAPQDCNSDEERYRFIVQEIEALVKGEPDLVANLANIAAVLKYSLEKISWVGFYLLKEEELVLGPFQGKPACIRIALGKGVCGTAAASMSSVVVPDVQSFPGHIFCDPDTRSEIVVPMINDGNLLGVLDVDSHRLAAFNAVDREHLEHIVHLISR